jgi:hypothetical protein
MVNLIAFAFAVFSIERSDKVNSTFSDDSPSDFFPPLALICHPCPHHPSKTLKQKDWFSVQKMVIKAVPSLYRS